MLTPPNNFEFLKKFSTLKSINKLPKDKLNPDVGRETWNFTNLSNML